MIRINKIPVPDAIFTSDWHLRDSIPPCRTDDFEVVQWSKVRFVTELQRHYNCPVYHVGDLFDNWKPSPYLLTQTFRYLPDQFFTIYGNHDLPQHNLDLTDKCGINTLAAGGALKVLPGCHWGQNPENKHLITIQGRNVLLWHTGVYQGTLPYIGCSDSSTMGLMRKYKGYDLIVTGHNHKSFVEEYHGRLLVNPGGITRQESDEAEVEPKVWLYYAVSNTVIPITIPHEKGVIVRAADTIKTEERNERIDAFISKLNSDYTTDIDFEKNLLHTLEHNKIEFPVKQIILKVIE